MNSKPKILLVLLALLTAALAGCATPEEAENGVENEGVEDEDTPEAEDDLDGEDDDAALEDAEGNETAPSGNETTV